MALLPIPTEAERILLRRLDEARRETAIARTLLAASFEREKEQDTLIRFLRRELLEAHDVAGRAEGAAERHIYNNSMSKVLPRYQATSPYGPFRDFRGETRKVGG